jgi:hypothetical protein
LASIGQHLKSGKTKEKTRKDHRKDQERPQEKTTGWPQERPFDFEPFSLF